MSRVVAFLAGLAAVFAAALALGAAFEPMDTEVGGSHGGGHGEQGTTSASSAAGLAVAEGGYSLRMAPTHLVPGRVREIEFRIEESDGVALRNFDRRHEREMHLIAIRRDGTHFQHLHPEMNSAGIWTAALTLPAAGVYRVFADFSAKGRSVTLATDLFASGPFEAQPFPASAAVDRVGGYEVRLEDDSPKAGVPTDLRFRVTADEGRGIDLESYLGSMGHLVALREGDLAFLHAHPEGHEHETGANVIPYAATFPTAGRYRLFLQFKEGGRVRTASFTVAVAR